MKVDLKRYKFIEPALPILQRLESAGFEAYLVGGCVREILRAEQCAVADILTDIDITTNARPEEILREFQDMPVIETGLKHGTVTVLAPQGMKGARLAPQRPKAAMLAPQEGPRPGDDAPVEFSLFGRLESASPGGRIPIEITTYRVDGDYSDGRHPDKVRFVTSLTEDLARRDFTVNAMAMDLRGEICDPFGGQQDLEAGIIRAVGDPETRFREDGLRILRALRFAAVLTKRPAGNGLHIEPAGDGPCVEPASEGFRIEPATEAALFQSALLLQKISAERIFIELKKLVCGPAAGSVVREYVDVLGAVIPELMTIKGFEQHNPYHNYDVLEHCIRALEAVRTTPENETYMKLTALLHDIGKPGVFTQDEKGIGHFYGHPQAGAEIVERILRRLKADRATEERIVTLVHYHDLVFQEDDRLLKRWMNRHTPQVLLEILEIKRADNIATGNVSQELLDKFGRIEQQIKRIWREAEAGQTCFQLKDLAVRGSDLLGEGVPKGPEVGRILQELLEAVIDGEVPNEKPALLKRVRAKMD